MTRTSTAPLAASSSRPSCLLHGGKDRRAIGVDRRKALAIERSLQERLRGPRQLAVEGSGESGLVHDLAAGIPRQHADNLIQPEAAHAHPAGHQSRRKRSNFPQGSADPACGGAKRRAIGRSGSQIATEPVVSFWRTPTQRPARLAIPCGWPSLKRSASSVRNVTFVMVTRSRGCNPARCTESGPDLFGLTDATSNAGAGGVWLACPAAIQPIEAMPISHRITATLVGRSDPRDGRGITPVPQTRWRRRRTTGPSARARSRWRA